VKFCEEHWDRLRELVVDRGLEDLIQPSGERAAEAMAAELEEGQNIRNFDPLMSAHWAILNNVLRVLGSRGMYLMENGDEMPEDPITPDHGQYAGEYVGQTWPRCPLCYLNIAHGISCTDPRCKLDKERGYDWMLERAVDDAKGRADALRAAG
jgi:hypothetical protein